MSRVLLEQVRASNDHIDLAFAVNSELECHAAFHALHALGLEIPAWLQMTLVLGG